MKLRKYFNYLMITLYVSLGIFMIIFNDHFNGYSKNSMTIFGIIIILYGLYRFGKTIQQQNQKDDE